MIKFGGLSGSSARAFDSDVLAWQTAVNTNGGSVSLARLVLVDQMVFGLKQAGDWTNTDDIFMYAAENPAQALTSLKLRLFQIPINTPVFTVDRGYVYDGVTNYIDTGFNAATMAVALTATDQTIGVYEITNLSGNSYAAGAIATTTNGMRVGPRFSANILVQAGFTGVQIPGPSDSRGLVCAYQSPIGPSYGAAVRGVSAGTTVPGATSPTLFSRTVFTGAVQNNAGTPGNFRASNLGFCTLGKSAIALSLSFYATMQAHMTAIGANV